MKGLKMKMLRISRVLVCVGVAALALSQPAACPGQDGVSSGQVHKVFGDLEKNGDAYFRQGTSWFLGQDYVAYLLSLAGNSRASLGSGGLYRPGLSRYDWEWLRRRLDKDGDNVVTPEEFAGPREWFDALDKNRDGVLTKEDFDWSAESALSKAGSQLRPLFERIDRDSNGRVSPEEWKQWFDSLSAGKGYLTQDDLLPLFMDGRRGAGKPATAGGGRMDRFQVICAYLAGDVGPIAEGPALNEKAPDFELATADGKGKLSLSGHRGKKPLVLTFGSFTCNRFRAQYGEVENLYRRYGKQADFVAVYVREAHPTDGWSLTFNERAGVSFAQPKAFEERLRVAGTCRGSLKMTMPVVVDEMDDRAGNAYCGMPERLYVIDTAGRVAFKAGRGPFGFKPSEMEQSLIMLLVDEAAPERPADPPRPGAKGRRSGPDR